jgi:hypothetical protein
LKKKIIKCFIITQKNHNNFLIVNGIRLNHSYFYYRYIFKICLLGDTIHLSILLKSVCLNLFEIFQLIWFKKKTWSIIFDRWHE